MGLQNLAVFIWAGGAKISELQKFDNWIDGSFCERGTEVFEQLKKRKVDKCYSQEVRRRGQVT